MEEEKKLDEAMQTIEKKRWFGRGIYGSKDVPIRILDNLIIFLVVLTVVLTVIFAVNGGYTVSFDTGGGTEIPSQKLRHGEFVTEPDIPVKAGYEFDGWYYGFDLENHWYFDIDKVSEDVTLTARWTGTGVPVKFDLNGGRWLKDEEPLDYQVIFGEVYGELPVPVKDGAEFAGWIYSGKKITCDTTVSVNGEHVLTAQWK